MNVVYEEQNYYDTAKIHYLYKRENMENKLHGGLFILCMY